MYIAYLSGPRPYREGIALYEEYGLNLMLKATFRRNAETDLLRATLMEERIRRDVWYIENWSFWLDIKIIFMTAKSIICPDKNAY